MVVTVLWAAQVLKDGYKEQTWFIRHDQLPFCGPCVVSLTQEIQARHLKNPTAQAGPASVTEHALDINKIRLSGVACEVGGRPIHF